MIIAAPSVHTSGLAKLWSTCLVVGSVESLQGVEESGQKADGPINCEMATPDHQNVCVEDGRRTSQDSFQVGYKADK
uniref:Uncharacterized protein n=1 Tax=Romanomermis culicivorax TaxID=13658 RepID=A0A915K996_ROMCU